MKASELKSKKITLATLKLFIKKANNLFVEEKSNFNGMTDCVESFKNTKMVEVSKEDAIGHNGVWCVGGSRNYFTFEENDNYFGIEVSNCCGHSILWTSK
jgi:hypothetical protein